MSGSGNDFVFFDARREPAGELEEPRDVKHLARLVVPADQVARDQFPQRLVGVDDGEAKRVGNVLLRNRDQQVPAFGEPDTRCPLVNERDTVRRPLQRAAAADT